MVQTLDFGKFSPVQADMTVYAAIENPFSSNDYCVGKVWRLDWEDSARESLDIVWSTGGMSHVPKADLYESAQAACANLLERFEAKLARLRSGQIKGA